MHSTSYMPLASFPAIRILPDTESADDRSGGTVLLICPTAGNNIISIRAQYGASGLLVNYAAARETLFD